MCPKWIKLGCVCTTKQWLSNGRQRIISKKWPNGRKRAKCGHSQLTMNKVRITSRRNDKRRYVPITIQREKWIELFAGRDEEALSSFADHIFFDEQLSWCPSRGPVRNFMDLVCVGLSKNPYLTVQQKHEHIEWYKNYFEEKKDVLERSIILDTKPQTPEITQ